MTKSIFIERGDILLVTFSRADLKFYVENPERSDGGTLYIYT